MPAQEEIQKLAEGVIASFDSGIGAIETLIDKGLEILDGYRLEQEAVRWSLRETLTSVGNLRRKDFDGVMERILAFQGLREVEIKRLIREFLGRQRELTGRLQRSLRAGIFQEVERIKNELAEMIEEARVGIQSFQREQERIRQTFESLEGRRGEIAAREFKKVIQDLEKELLGEETVGSGGRSAAG